ncbi:MAG: hypothetical protein HW421_2279 [Ignavibacteria bacterium]|nr:hypothetical protein [Ignavibacteria bacterium]
MQKGLCTKKYRWIPLSIILILYSCSSPKPITFNDFRGFSEIMPGDSVQLKWSFGNTDKVKIEGFDSVFAATDSITVHPNETTIYYFDAFQTNQDSIRLYWRIASKEITKPKETKPGPEPETNTNLSPEFFSGSVRTSETNPSMLKIMRIMYPEDDSEDFVARVMLLDKNGNYFNGYKPESEAHIFTVAACDTDETSEIYTKIRDEKFVKETHNLSVAFTLDNSAQAYASRDVFDSVKSYIRKSQNNLNWTFSYYNHNPSKSIPVSPSDKALPIISKMNLPEPNGLNGYYKANCQSLWNLCTDSKERNLVQIQIVFGADNSSVIYNESDVIDVAIKNRVPIYIIAIGDAVDSYTLKYITSATGGKFYHLTDDKIQFIKQIFDEIIFSNQNYYEIEVPASFLKKHCSTAFLSVNIREEEEILTDNTHLVFEYQPLYQKYQAIASFQELGTELTPDFNENIRSLARVLKDNPGNSIKLIGHSSYEIDEAEDIELAKRRAEVVESRLVELGVDEKQVFIKSEGSNNPIYYFQEYSWQKYYNRRVDVRWLNPELLPYEIIAGIYPSETLALISVDKWSKLGKLAYYERYLQNGNPVYRIKLWGFRTRDQAVQELNKLKKKSKDSYNID